MSAHPNDSDMHTQQTVGNQKISSEKENESEQ